MLEDRISGKELAVETRYGRLATVDGQDVISRFLARYGEWAWDEAAFVASTVPEGARALDVGAFLGTFGLGLALHRPLSLLCFVEANPAVLPLLEANVRENATVRAVVVEGMVGASGTPPRPGRVDPFNLGSTSFAEDAAGERSAATPNRVLTLADLRDEHGPFDLIKLDVEGMEQEILRGDREHLARGETTLWIECNERPQSLELGELLLSWGLEIHYFAFPSHNPDNFRGDNESIFPWAYEAGLLVAPKRPVRLDSKLTEHGCILRQVRSVEDLRDALWLTPRWLPAELANAGAVELAAAAGRALRGQSREAFLSAGAAPAGQTLTIWEQLKATEAGLARAEALAFERSDLLEVAAQRLAKAEALALERSEQLEVAEQRLAAATALALARLAELGPERQRADAATAEARAANERADVAKTQARAAEQRADAAKAEASAAEQRADMAKAEASAAEQRADAAKAEASAAEQRADMAKAEASAAEQRADTAQAEARAAEQALVALRMSVVWRLATPFMRFIGNRPRLHAALRRVRGRVGAALRRRR